uniref:Uncharacterized protein LOC105041942 n=1 Tax=Elaeis guineensis var. tenera TaxID=51953 RepID=A0A8N4ID29_ELAGV|nr:uncharacterized protein LOC105041942 [Elaeis guineensis]
MSNTLQYWDCTFSRPCNQLFDSLLYKPSESRGSSCSSAAILRGAQSPSFQPRLISSSNTSKRSDLKGKFCITIPCCHCNWSWFLDHYSSVMPCLRVDGGTMREIVTFSTPDCGILCTNFYRAAAMGVYIPLLWMITTI